MRSVQEKIVLKTSNLSIGYPATHQVLLNSLNLQLRAGEMVCFMGPNGIGKSTLIRTLAGLQQPISGELAYPLSGNGEESIVDQIAVVLTEKISAVNMTVYELITFGRYPYLDWSVRLSEQDRKIITEAIEQVRIQGLTNKKLYQLSDGQLQMAMIARALAQSTPVLLLDEPTAHLDLNNRIEIMRLLRNLAHKTGKAILVATHELDLALQTADLIWLTGKNKNIITGIPEDLVLNGAFDDIFEFKGYDLKTGKVQHEAHHGKTIQLVGQGSEYLWTKNALERSGFIVTEGNGDHMVRLQMEGNDVFWILDNRSFTTLAELLNHLI